MRTEPNGNHDATGAVRVYNGTGTAIAANKLVVVTGHADGAYPSVELATNTDSTKRRGVILVAKHDLPAGRTGIAVPWKIITGVTVAGGTLAPIYLGTDGDWLETDSADNDVVVGVMLEAGASNDGAILLDPGGVIGLGAANLPDGVLLDSNVDTSDLVLKAQGTITSAEVLALNATPFPLLEGPQDFVFFELVSLHLWLQFNTTAYDGIAAGEDLIVSYTDGSGEEVARIETTGFLDATADAHRVVHPKAGTDAVADFTPVQHGDLVLSLLAGEIATGDSDLHYEILYRLRDFTW